jgi:hypothetical protein
MPKGQFCKLATDFSEPMAYVSMPIGGCFNTALPLVGRLGKSDVSQGGGASAIPLVND